MCTSKQDNFLCTGHSSNCAFPFADHVPHCSLVLKNTTTTTSNNTATASDKHWEGMTCDQCRAISMVAFGNPDQYELVFLSRKNRVSALVQGQIDVLGIFFAWSVASDIFTPSKAGIWFSSPCLYSGFGFCGHPDYVKCADRLDSWSPECRALRACVVSTSVNADTLQKILPGAVVVPCDTADDLTTKFVDGECNVVATWPVGSPEMRFRLAGHNSAFVMGENRFTHEDLSVMAQDDDPEWQRIIEIVIQTFIFAEANNITQANAEEIRKLFHDGGKSSLAATMEAIISEFGNYGPTPNGTLERILELGYLKCGVMETVSARRALDVELCHGVAAALFAGDKNKVEIIKLAANVTNKGGHHPHEALDNGLVDVVAGARLTLEVLLGEPPFEDRYYAFSKPYFYDNQTMSAHAMMSRADDSQWNSFVFWVEMSIIHAEEEHITQRLCPRCQSPAYLVNT